MSKKYQVVKGDSLWGLAERFYGDGRLYPVIGDHILLGQKLEIPYVTFRHRVVVGDTKKKLAQHFYHDETMSAVFEIPNGAAQRDLIVGEWLAIPDLVNPGHHTVALGETWEALAHRWYGEAHLRPIIAIANNMSNQNPQAGQVLIQTAPESTAHRGRRGHTVEAGQAQLRRLKGWRDAHPDGATANWRVNDVLRGASAFLAAEIGPAWRSSRVLLTHMTSRSVSYYGSSIPSGRPTTSGGRGGCASAPLQGQRAVDVDR